MSIIPNNRADKLISFSDIESRHKKSIYKARVGGCSMLFASILGFISCIVIVCSLLIIFLLDGVNVMHQLFFPAILPSIIGILFSIPFIVIALRKQKEKTKIQTELALDVFNELQNFVLNTPVIQEEEVVADFIKKFICFDGLNSFYKIFFINEVKKKFPKKNLRTEKDNHLIKILDKVKQKISHPNSKEKKE